MFCFVLIVSTDSKRLSTGLLDLVSVNLDWISGAEFPVLKTIPFDKVDISLMDIEINHIGEIFEGDPDDLKDLLEDNGYEFHSFAKIDALFVKKGLVKQFEKKAKKAKTKKKN